MQVVDSQLHVWFHGRIVTSWFWRIESSHGHDVVQVYIVLVQDKKIDKSWYIS